MCLDLCGNIQREKAIVEPQSREGRKEEHHLTTENTEVFTEKTR
jgi:hypothetical protein